MTAREKLIEAKNTLELTIMEAIKEFSDETGFTPYAVDVIIMKTPLYNNPELCCIETVDVKIKL